MHTLDTFAHMTTTTCVQSTQHLTYRADLKMMFGTHDFRSLCTHTRTHTQGVHTVINYEMPRTRDTYIHRVGRTARASRSGRAVTLIGESRRLVMKEVLKTQAESAEIKSRAVPQTVIDHYRCVCYAYLYVYLFVCYAVFVILWNSSCKLAWYNGS